jgi:hypothetical protein
MDMESLYTKSLALCHKEWAQSIYTSITMLDFILKSTGKSWEQFVREPSFTEKEKEEVEKRISNATEESLCPLWNDGTGLCTSWCVKIMSSSELFNNPDAGIYGDQGNHRAAFYNNGLVVDSSAREPLLFKGDEKVTRFNTTWWMIDVGSSDARLLSVRLL